MTVPAVKTRLPALDIARGIAILCMASYHFSWDLEFFHYLDPGTVGTGFFKIYARMIASSFLLMAGFSLYLSHGERILWKKFGYRLALIAASAAAVTAVTSFATPDEFIFFGILHQIALASVIGLLFLRLPAIVPLAVGIAAIIAPYFLRSEMFDTPFLWWVGLSTIPMRSSDYVPVVPWTGAFLIGLAACRFGLQFNILARFAHEPTSHHFITRFFGTAGRHSLAIYLVHQPLLFGLVWCVAQIAPAPLPDPSIGFQSNCETQCGLQYSPQMCTVFCSCTLEKLKESDLLRQLQSRTVDPKKDEGISQISEMCTLKALESETKQ